MKKYFLITMFALIIGFSTGLTVSNYVGQDGGGGDSKQDMFCQQVETGIQEEMETGFVNCFEPSGGYFGLREDIRNSTSISCICRKKINGVVQQVKIAEPDQ